MTLSGVYFFLLCENFVENVGNQHEALKKNYINLYQRKNESKQ